MASLQGRRCIVEMLKLRLRWFVSYGQCHPVGKRRRLPQNGAHLWPPKKLGPSHLASPVQKVLPFSVCKSYAGDRGSPAPLQTVSQAACSPSGLGVQSAGAGRPASPSSQKQQERLCSRTQYFQAAELIGHFPMQNLAGSRAKLA